jgi:ATP-dependent RNA helicase DeaD
MGFIDDMDEIIRFTNPEKRTLLFSATMPARIKDLARKYLGDYQLISAKKKQLTTTLTEQIYYEVRYPDKFEALCRIIDIEEEFYGLVFCRTKSDVDEVATHLQDRGYDAEAIHGDISQAQRERTLAKFKKRKSTILVATDVAARGIDVSDLTHVINYSLPQDPESYVHRIGRTGRAGRRGTAITFITPGEYKRLMFIQKNTRSEIKKSRIPKVKQIIKAKLQRLSETLQEKIETGTDPQFSELADMLLNEAQPQQCIAALLEHFLESELNPDTYAPISEGPPRRGGGSIPGQARLFVAMGKADRCTPARLVSLIAKKGSVPPHLIRDVQVMESFSFITVPFEAAEAVIGAFNPQGKRPLITRARDKGGADGGKKKKPYRR